MSEKNKSIVQAVNTAFAENKTEDFLKHCADDIVWRMVGDKTTQGRDEIRKFMAEMVGTEPPVFSVDQLISEGNSVVCFGDMSLKNNEGAAVKYSYCDIFRFREGKIIGLQSFVTPTESEREGEKTAGA